MKYTVTEKSDTPPFFNYIPPTWDELFMKDVYEIATKSKDPRSKLGAILVEWESKFPFSRGYNDFPRKVKDRIPERWERPEKYFWVAHAEANSILNCARKGIKTEGSVMFTQGVPCDRCTVDVIQAGIVEVIVHKQWQEYERKFNWEKWQDSAIRSKSMLDEAGIKIRVFDGILKVKGFLDGKVIDL